MENKEVTLVFTDECGVYQKDRTEKNNRSHPFYVRSNLMISINDYLHLEDKMKELKKQININPKIEIKWSHLGNLLKGNDKLLKYNINLSNLQLYFVNLLKEICNCKSAELFFSLTNNKKIGKVDEIKLIKMHLQNTYQRVQIYSKKRNSVAFIIADDMNNKNKDLKNALYNLTLEGDQFTDYENINKVLFIDYSDQCCGLQVADICAGAFTASLKYITVEENEKHKFNFGYGLLINILSDIIRCNENTFPYSEVYGYGVREVPNDSGKKEAQEISRIILNKINEPYTI